MADFEAFIGGLGAEAERQGLTEEQLAAVLDEDKQATYKGATAAWVRAAGATGPPPALRPTPPIR
jgi:hypothetical protein